jgi:DNA-binding Lrp family transcriptional regulator
MTEISSEERRILSHLRSKASQGEQYVRARQIADSIGLSSKQVGARLASLGEKAEDLTIEKWGRSRSTTWRVERA